MYINLKILSYLKTSSKVFKLCLCMFNNIYLQNRHNELNEFPQNLFRLLDLHQFAY